MRTVICVRTPTSKRRGLGDRCFSNATAGPMETLLKKTTLPLLPASLTERSPSPISAAASASVFLRTLQHHHALCYLRVRGSNAVGDSSVWRTPAPFNRFEAISRRT